MTPLVALLILTWNRRDDVLRCVASLPRVEYPNLLPVVIDNASRDDTVAALRGRDANLEIIENARNLGYAGGNNVGIRWALERGADYVLIANSDTEMTPGLVSELVRVAEGDPRIAVVGCRNLLMEDPGVLWGAYGELTYGPFVVHTAGERVPDGERWRVVRDVDSVIGNGYLWRRQALERVGLLDESFFGYHEDLDWCLRARRAGYRVVYAGTAAIIHKGGSSSDRRQVRSFPMSYFLGRNGVLFVRKHGAAAEKIRFAFFCGAALGARWLRACLAAAVSAGAGRGKDLLAMERGFTKGLWDALRERPVPFEALGLEDAVPPQPLPEPQPEPFGGGKG